MRLRTVLLVVLVTALLCGVAATAGTAIAETASNTTDDATADEELIVTLGNESGDVGTTVDVPLTVAATDAGPDEIVGHEFTVEYDPEVVTPVHEPDSDITLQHADGTSTYTVGDTDPGVLRFSTLDDATLPLGSAGDFGEPLVFEVGTDEAVETTINLSATFDEAEGGDYTVEYEPATVTLNEEPENIDGTLGDVSQNDDVTINDAVAIQRESLGLDPESVVDSFDVRFADVNRDGSVTITDAVLAQRKSLGIADGPAITVQNVSAPATATVGDDLIVTGTVENAGNIGVVDPVEYRVDDAAQSSRTVDLGGNRTDRSSQQVGFLLDTADFEAGNITHELALGDANQTATTTLEPQPEEPAFEIESFDAPEETFVDEQFEVEATVENVGGADGEVTIAYQYDSDEIDDKDRSIAAGESETVTFTFTPDTAETVTHGVTAGEDEVTAQLDVVEEDDDAQVIVDLGDATGDETSPAEVSITVEEGDVNPPESVPGHDFAVEYDASLLSPAYDGGDEITLQGPAGGITYTVGGSPGDGELEFSTLAEPDLPFGSAGDLGEALVFTVDTDDAVETTVSVTASFDDEEEGEFVVEYDDATVTLNQ